MKFRGLAFQIASPRNMQFEPSSQKKDCQAEEKTAIQRAVSGRPKAFGKCSNSKSFSSLHKMDMMSKR